MPRWAPARQLTPGAEELATLAGTVGSFAEAAEKLLPLMAGLRLGESTVERTAEAAGERLGDLWVRGRPSGRPSIGVGIATLAAGPSPTPASTPRASASRGHGGPRPTAG